jgi:hypothetical protein
LAHSAARTRIAALPSGARHKWRKIRVRSALAIPASPGGIAIRPLIKQQEKNYIALAMLIQRR